MPDAADPFQASIVCGQFEFFQFVFIIGYRHGSSRLI
jgi:hypothetical protein